MVITRVPSVLPPARFYMEVARLGYRRYAAYRSATLAGIFTNLVFGLMRAYVLIALFKERPHTGGYTVSDALTYTWLTQGALMVVYVWGWYDVAERIRSGDIVIDLQRPFDFELYWLSQDLGRALYHGIFRGIPPFVLGALVFHLAYPTSPLTYAAFVVSLALAVCVSFGLRFIVNLAAFWLLDYRGIVMFAAIFWTFLSGFVVPLAIFPEPWRSVAGVLPFAGMVQVPVDVFLGKYPGVRLAGALALQAGWAIVLLGVGRLLLRAGQRRLVVQGG